MTTIDDKDPRVVYSGTWYTGGGPFEYLGTVTFAGAAGSSVALNFTGTMIGVYGTITHIGMGIAPVSNYSIDSGVPYQYTATQLIGDQHEQLFFQVTNLSFAPHTLVATNMVDNDYFYIDYFQVGISVATTTATTSSRPSSLPSTAAAAVTVTAQASGKQSGPPIGAVVGGVIAGFAILSLTICALFFLRRQRKTAPHLLAPTQPLHPETRHVHREHTPNVTPFVIGEPLDQPTSQANPGSGVQGPIDNGRGTGSGIPPFHAAFPSGFRQKGLDLPPEYTIGLDVEQP